MRYYPSPLPLHPSPLVSWSPFHHGVQLVEGEPRHGMMPLRDGFGVNLLPALCGRCSHTEDMHAGDKDCMCGQCMWFVR